MMIIFFSLNTFSTISVYMHNLFLVENYILLVGTLKKLFFNDQKTAKVRCRQIDIVYLSVILKIKICKLKNLHRIRNLIIYLH